ncbi:MAG: hypothetical protein KDK91_22325, partial [Gammaproteobacteria bacterium]|nr:hypothetical protein [Gammaproteobacteria bacterium]
MPPIPSRFEFPSKSPFVSPSSTPGSRRGWRLLVGLLVLLCAAPAHSSRDPLADQEQALAAVRSAIAKANREFQQTSGEHEREVTALRRIEIDIAQLGARLRDTEQALQREQIRLRSLSARRAELGDSVQQHRRRLSRLARSAYVVGRHDRLQLLLNQEDPSRVSRLWLYHAHFGRAQAESIRRLTAELEQLARLERERGEALSSLSTSRAELRTLGDSLTRHRAERTQAISRLEQALAGQGSTLASLQIDEARLQGLLSTLRSGIEKAARDPTSASSANDDEADRARQAAPRPAEPAASPAPPSAGAE